MMLSVQTLHFSNWQRSRAQFDATNKQDTHEAAQTKHHASERPQPRRAPGSKQPTQNSTSKVTHQSETRGFVTTKLGKQDPARWEQHKSLARQCVLTIAETAEVRFSIRRSN